MISGSCCRGKPETVVLAIPEAMKQAETGIACRMVEVMEWGCREKTKPVSQRGHFLETTARIPEPVSYYLVLQASPEEERPEQMASHQALMANHIRL